MWSSHDFYTYCAPCIRGIWLSSLLLANSDECLIFTPLLHRSYCIKRFTFWLYSVKLFHQLDFYNELSYCLQSSNREVSLVEYSLVRILTSIARYVWIGPQRISRRRATDFPTFVRMSSDLFLFVDDKCNWVLQKSHIDVLCRSVMVHRN